MSGVRLSSGSPTLERAEARQAEHPKPSACRNLFGPVDHDALARELRRHHRELEEAGRRRWNFDFQRHRPLDGRYQWRALGRAALPDFYGRSPGSDGNGNGDRPTAPRSRCSQGTAGREALGADAEAAAAGAPRDVAARGAGQRKRPASDDPSPRNKRASRTEEAAWEECPDGSPAEQTPEKCSPRQRPT